MSDRLTHKQLLRKKNAQIAGLHSYIKRLEAANLTYQSDELSSWREGYKAGRDNLQAQHGPELEIARSRGYRQAERDLAWKPSASDYL